MLQVETTDAETLARYNIQCAHIGSAAANRISLPEEIAPQGLLRLSIAGTGNRLAFSGARLPTGIIHLVENRSSVTIACRSEVNLELWMYEKAAFTLEEAFAVYGLHAWVYNETRLSIGKYCLLSDQIYMRTSDHHSIIDLGTMEQINFPGDITVAERVWIGQGVTILKGVEIGDGSIVASCALVNCSIPRVELWGGVPARCLRKEVSWVPSHPADPRDIELMARALGLVADRPNIWQRLAPKRET